MMGGTVGKTKLTKIDDWLKLNISDCSEFARATS